ncbi:hypothetical protein P170DRAFT_479765 [Aspergillus steynii IBT 23096]|uniref:AT hook motif protein n=1 Tax=Aspergillus steynii IBT 23096 TaxID=1392250 RepID=A0A2I2FXE1_9EURO|nr:uncharacterized protein P170DRAFT_479765 [Aspergillus steynii IBT 23096]PLB45246.1 hypothetical protein P170DRAFT_479765 [Aspergillus steynii IBT 23096]
MPMNWNDQADARLLVAILQTMTGKLDTAAIAKHMGTECTVSAIQHRIQRIKEKAANAGENDSPAAEQTSAAASPAPSPEKRKRGRPAGTKKVNKPVAKKAKADGEDMAAEGNGEALTEA